MRVYATQHAAEVLGEARALEVLSAPLRAQEPDVRFARGRRAPRSRRARCLRCRRWCAMRAKGPARAGTAHALLEIGGVRATLTR